MPVNPNDLAKVIQKLSASDYMSVKDTTTRSNVNNLNDAMVKGPMEGRSGITLVNGAGGDVPRDATTPGNPNGGGGGGTNPWGRGRPPGPIQLGGP